MIFTNNPSLISALKMQIKNSGYTLTFVCNKLEIVPQRMTDILTKKNFSFNDCSDILKAIGYKLNVSFAAQNDDFFELYDKLSALQKAEIKGIIKGMLR
jgi:hypothetical protein